MPSASLPPHRSSNPSERAAAVAYILQAADASLSKILMSCSCFMDHLPICPLTVMTTELYMVGATGMSCHPLNIILTLTAA